MSIFQVKNGELILDNGLFCHKISGVEKASAVKSDAAGLSVPFTDITAEGAGRVRHYHVWDDLPLVYMPDYGETELLTLPGDHWEVRAVKLNAFTDDNDTLTSETQRNMFMGKLFNGMEGEMFFLEDNLSGDAIVIICETPDYKSGKLTIKDNVLSVECGTDSVALGFCKKGQCEALARNYYRHARAPRKLITMSNTWGDGNGYSRICRDFVLKEIDAAKDLGIDIVQVDDGWQTGNTDTTQRDELGRRCFPGDFWKLREDLFPGGMKEVTDYATKGGMKVGLWFAPDPHDDFSYLDRDIAALRKAYEEWGFRFFKLDMFWVMTDTERDRFLHLLKTIYSFGDDVAVQLDVTRNLRMNYLCGRQYGTVFVENRYNNDRRANSYPHRILRNLWSLGKYMPTQKFQFELVNPDLRTVPYPEGDVFVPALYDMDYLFASVMLANPLIWMEMQFLSQERRADLKKIMAVWKEHRDALSKADVLPIGEKPSGRSFTGFYADSNEGKYLLLFREVTDNDSAVITAPVAAGDVEILAANADAKVTLEDGQIRVSLSKPRAYVFVKIK